MASLRKRGKSWQIDYYIGGKRQRENLGPISEHLAKVKLKQIENDSLFGFDHIKLSDYIPIYLKWFNENYPSTYRTKELNVNKFVKPIFANIRIDLITNRDIERFKQSCSDNKPATINRKLADLKGLISRAKVDGYRTPNIIIENVKDNTSKPPKLYSKAEIDKILDNDNETSHWWLFLANTGLRLAEFYWLETENIKHDSIYVLSGENRTKSGKWRYVPLTPIAKECLNDFDMSSQYLLPRPYKIESIKKRFRRICEKAEIDKSKWGVHCLRHTFCSYLMMSGANIAAVKEIMGHQDIRTTMGYAHLSPSHLQNEVKNFKLGE